MTRIRSLILSTLCLSALCGLVTTARAQPPSKVSAALSEKAERNGMIRVLVLLNTEAPTLGTQGRQPDPQATAKTKSKAAPITGRNKETALLNKRLVIQQASRNVLQRLPKNVAQVREFDDFPLLRAEVDAAGLRALAASPEVLRVVEDRRHQPTLAQSVELIEAGATQALGFRGQGQAIAVLDTGVDANHPFLAPRVVEEACFSSNSSSTTTVCPNGQETELGTGAATPCSANGCAHGTHVAGISAGNGASFNGVAPDASVIAVQVFSRVDSTNACLPNPAPCITAFTSDIIAGLQRVFQLRNTYDIAAVNMSLGGGSSTVFCDDDPIKTAIDALRDAGIASVISSGNEGGTNSMSSPACISSSVSVGSTTKIDSVSSFSNSTTFLTLLAPGSQITSSVPGGGFAAFSGTSMAAPHVAGALAAIRSADPQVSVDNMISALSTNGLPVTDNRNQVVKPRIRLNQAIAGIGNVGNADLAVMPLAGLVASGEPGGPFAPPSTEYRLSNNGSDPLPFEISTSQPWLSAEPSAGVIAAGEATQVTLSLAAAAADLLPGTYSTSILFDNTSGVGGDTLRTATLTVQPAGSANDKFSNAVLLTENSGTTLGNNLQAGIESGEPVHGGNPGGASVWWQWVAPANGEITIDTEGSDFDTTLGVYTGATISTLSTIASNDDDGIGFTSSATFNVAVGTSYLIAVDGFRGPVSVARGSVVLNWRYTEDGAGTGSLAVTPAEGLFASGSLGGPFSPAATTYTLTNTGAGSLNLDVLTNGTFLSVGSVPDQLAAGASTTLEVTINSGATSLGPGTTTGSVIINGVSRTVAVTVNSDGVLQDDFSDRTIIDGAGPLTLLATNTASTKEPGEPNHAGNPGGSSVWWSWTAPVSGTVIIDTLGSNYDTLLAAYTGNSVAGLTEVTANDDSVGLQSRISFTASSGADYAIAVDGYSGESGSIRLNLQMRDDRPPGDDFANAQPLSAALSLNDTLAATAENNEPQHAGVAGGKSVWWRWQSAGGEQVVIDTFGSNFDTLLAVYVGEGLPGLARISSNDDAGSLQSQVSFTAAPSQVYHIVVDGFAGASGSVRLNVQGAALAEQLVASTLPTSRSVRVGDPATVFATLINTSSQNATGCTAGPDIELPVTFRFLQTDPATNQTVVSTENQPFEIAAGAAKTLVLGFTASQPLPPIEVPLIFSCDSLGAARIISGLNTIVLSASNNIVADIVALAATATNQGVVLAGPGQGDSGAFSVATVNVGATEVITATPTAAFADPAVALSICQTNPTTGACLTQPAPSVTVNITADETPTFSVFVSPSAEIAFAPDLFRLQVIFSDPTGNVRGSTSVAVSTSLP